MASHPRVRYQAIANITALQAPIAEWIGADCPVDFLNVWFPAHSMPSVFQAIQQKGEQYRAENPMWFDAPARDADSAKLVHERAEALQSRELRFEKGARDPNGDIPTLVGKLNRLDSASSR